MPPPFKQKGSLPKESLLDWRVRVLEDRSRKGRTDHFEILDLKSFFLVGPHTIGPGGQVIGHLMSTKKVQ